MPVPKQLPARARKSSPGSVYTISDSEVDDYAPEGSSSPAPETSKRAVKARPTPSIVKGKGKAKVGGTKRKASESDIEDGPAGLNVERPHNTNYHSIGDVAELQEDLLRWFEEAREKRGMPWRKKYDPDLSMEEKGQRAYELIAQIWVSEIMLQQTQVATVIAYWQRWIEKWPTIADLAKADVEEVNAMWRGLGYYRRARSLLSGAKTVMGDKKYKGRLPDDVAKMEKDIDGVGRYTAGAICSMAYGIRTPIIDGNIHRLFTRLFAIHASQVSPQTIKALWAAASDLIETLPMEDNRKGIAGDWNQALMELGSQVCKPVGPDCSACPLQPGCKAFSELKAAPPSPKADSTVCTLCEPIPTTTTDSRIPSVSIFPMKKEKKTSREENEVVCVTEVRRGEETSWLFLKRPEKGLLAGLFEPPTIPIPADTSIDDQKSAALFTISTLTNRSVSQWEQEGYSVSHSAITSIPHIFSHINMTYHIQHLVISHPGPKDEVPILPSNGVWLDSAGVENANIGTGVKKVWAEIYGKWGLFVAGGVKEGKGKGKGTKNTSAGTKRKSVSKLEETGTGGKVVKKIMMPMMPSSGSK